MIKEFQMTKNEMDEITKASLSEQIVTIDSISYHPHEKKERLWRVLGDKYGFNWTTVQPIKGKEFNFFTAEAT